MAESTLGPYRRSTAEFEGLRQRWLLVDGGPGGQARSTRTSDAVAD